MILEICLSNEREAPFMCVDIHICMDMSVYVGMCLLGSWNLSNRCYMSNMPETTYISLSLSTTSVWLRHLASGLRCYVTICSAQLGTAIPKNVLGKCGKPDFQEHFWESPGCRRHSSAQRFPRMFLASVENQTSKNIFGNHQGTYYMYYTVLCVII